MTDSGSDTGTASGFATWESLVEGEGPPPRETGRVELTDIVRYQGASGDLHPGHFDFEYAKAHGYPQLLSIGMLHASYLSAFATDWLGPENIRYFKMHFKDAVWLHDSVTYSGTVQRKFVDDGERKVELQLACVKGNGRVAVSMSALFVVPTSEPL